MIGREQNVAGTAGRVDAFGVNPMPEPELGFTPEPEDDPEDYLGHSLLEDVQALIDDGKTYAQAELNYQVTRAAYTADRAKGVAIFGAGAALVAFVAAIALAVGLIIALTPLITAWGATALVVGALLIVAWLMARRALDSLSDIQAAFSDKDSSTRTKP